MMQNTTTTVCQAVIEASTGTLLVGFLGTSYAMSVQAMDVEWLCRNRLEFLPVCGEPALYSSYSVRGLPTYVLFEDGKEVGRHLGRLDATALDSLLEAALGAIKCQ